MERQIHGFDFQNRIIAEKNLYKINNYTHQWDAINKHTNPEVMVSIKYFKYKTELPLGDIFRQYHCDDFELIFGFWKNNVSNLIGYKWIYISNITWNSILGDYNILVSFKEEFKNISNNKTDDLKWKNLYNKYKKLWINNKQIIQLRAKRDHKQQKRIQCAIPWKFIPQLIKLPNVKIIEEKYI